MSFISTAYDQILERSLWKQAALLLVYDFFVDCDAFVVTKT